MSPVGPPAPGAGLPASSALIMGVSSARRDDSPPPDLTGLGLWSVRRQTGELGGRIVWAEDGHSLTLTVQLPDR